MPPTFPNLGDAGSHPALYRLILAASAGPAEAGYRLPARRRHRHRLPRHRTVASTTAGCFFALVRFWPGNALAIRSRQDAARRAVGRTSPSAYDGSGQRRRHAHLSRRQAGGMRRRARQPEQERARAARSGLTFGERFRSSGFKGGVIDELQGFQPCADRPSRSLSFTTARPWPTRSGRRQGRIFCRPPCVPITSPPSTRKRRRRASELRQARQRLFAAQTDVFEIMTMEEMPPPRQAYILARGNYDAPKDKPVGRLTPAVLPPFPEGRTAQPARPGSLADRRRTIPDGPRGGQSLLAARSSAGASSRPRRTSAPRGAADASRTARLAGARLHGLGLGHQASVQTRSSCPPPTASALPARPELRERDPDNSLLARGPSRRLTAEDAARRGPGGRRSARREGRRAARQAVPAAGTLAWPERFPARVRAPTSGEGLHRRSLYTFWRRTSPPPDMLALRRAEPRGLRRAPADRPARPLQPLVLLNDPQFVEAARGLGERMLREGGHTLRRSARLRLPRRQRRAGRPTASVRPACRVCIRRSASFFAEDPGTPPEVPADRRISAGARAGPGGAGGRDRHGQRHPQPRRCCHDAGDFACTPTTLRIHFRSRAATFCRRHGLGLGSLALDTLLPAAEPLPPRACSARRTFPPRLSASSTCSRAAARAQQDLFDYKPLLNEKNGQQLPDHVRGGQRLTGMSVNQASIPLAGSVFKFARHGKGGAWLSELLPHTATRRGRPVLRQGRCSPRRSTTTRPSPSSRPASQIAGRPSHGLVGQLRPGIDEREPARVRRAGHARTRATSRCTPACGATASSTPRTRASSSRPARTRCSTSPIPRASSPPAAASMLDTLAALNRVQYRARARPRDRVAHGPVRDGLPHADERARGDGLPQGAEARPRSVRSRRRIGPAPSPPTACWRAGWPSAACVSSSSITRAGTSTATCRPAIRGQARETDQPSAALVQDLKQRGLLDDTLVIWGGEFGRTSYSQGKLTPGQLWPRPPPALLHHVAGRRRRQGGLTYGQTDAYGYNIADEHGHPDQPRQEPLHAGRRPCPRLAGDHSAICWASTTPG